MFIPLLSTYLLPAMRINIRSKRQGAADLIDKQLQVLIATAENYLYRRLYRSAKDDGNAEPYVRNK